MTSELFFALLPEHILLVLLVSLMVLEVFRADRHIAGLLFTLALAAGCGVLLVQLCQGYEAVVLPEEVVVDRLALITRLVLLGCGALLGISALGSSAGSKYWMLLASSLLGGAIVMESAGFVTLFIGIEMLSLPAFALMVHGCGSTRVSEGAFKYLLLSSVATALLLFGISLAYGSTNSLSIAPFTTDLETGDAQVLVATTLILCALFLKAAVFPFHGWAPDAYSSARMPVTAFLASVVKAAVVLTLARVLSELPLSAETITVILCLSLLSIFYGNVAAIRQTGFKRMLAYSSIAHAGYMIFALVDRTGGRVEALLYYVAVYAVTTIVACACFGMIATGGGDELDALDGAFARRPVPAVLMALAALSLAGIPPLPGFLAKLFIFKSVIASGHLVAAVFAFAGSYVGVVYYSGIVFRLFRPSVLATRREPERSAGWNWGGVLVGTLVLLLFMLVPEVFNG